MASLDLKSTLVAGVIGSGAMLIIVYAINQSAPQTVFNGLPPANSGFITPILYGFIIGIIVQTGVRLTGVS